MPATGSRERPSEPDYFGDAFKFTILLEGTARTAFGIPHSMRPDYAFNRYDPHHPSRRCGLNGPHVARPSAQRDLADLSNIRIAARNRTKKTGMRARLYALALFFAAAAARGEDAHLPPAGHSDWLGAPSCSARACHGSPGPQRSNPFVWGNEHTIWRELDPHQHAYAALFAPRSQEIAERLQLKQPAHEARQCLVCHAPAAMDSAKHEPAATCMPTYVTEGVGCESCHGPARGWIAAHTAADWSLFSPQEKERLGFRNTKNLVARAELCITCHVGSGEADVNHDLIAAGHPRLTFEFASHLHRMPLHLLLPHLWHKARSRRHGQDDGDDGF